MNEEINSLNFTKEILQSEAPVMLDFFAPWCNPCKMLSAELEKISDKYGAEIRICKVNVDNETKLAAQYGVYGVPTVIFFKNGTVADRFSGFRSAEEIEEMISRICLPQSGE